MVSCDPGKSAQNGETGVVSKVSVDEGEGASKVSADCFWDWVAVSHGMVHGGNVGDYVSSGKTAAEAPVCGTASPGAVGASSCNLWQYWSESWQTWFDMSKEYCILHDKVVAQKWTDFEYFYPRQNGSFYRYEVDFPSMEQMNCNTGKVRSIRRLVVSSPY